MGGFDEDKEDDVARMAREDREKAKRRAAQDNQTAPVTGSEAKPTNEADITTTQPTAAQGMNVPTATEPKS